MTSSPALSSIRRAAICLALSVVPGLAATNVTAGLPALSGPAFKAVADSYTAARTNADNARKVRLVTLIRRYHDEADQMLVEKKKTRNTTGMAVAAAAMDFFQAALTNVEASGAVPAPQKVRRELESSISEFSIAVRHIETDYTNQIERILRDHLDRFSALVYEARPDLKGTLDEATLSARFQSLRERAEQAETPPPGDTGAPAAGRATTNAPPAAPPLPEILATTGEAPQWATVGQWSAAMAGMDVITLPLRDMTPGTNHTTKFNPITAKDSQIDYVCLHALAPMPGMLFRLKRVPDRHAVNVLEWPSSRNDDCLIVRVPATAQFPSLHAFELQVAFPGQNLGALFAGAALEAGAAKAAAPVAVTLLSTPAGASVSVDGAPVPGARTPCRIPVQRGSHTLGLTLPGYLPAELTNQVFASDRTINWAFQPDPRTIRKSFAVSATADRWVSEGVRVAKGDVISVEADGNWSCGPGKELCDAEGYPNSSAFVAYYKDPDTYRRQMPDARYGALLMRVGVDGPPMLVGKALRVAAPAAGLLYFDINEGTGNRFRQDNAGTVVLRLLVAPPGP